PPQPTLLPYTTLFRSPRTDPHEQNGSPSDDCFDFPGKCVVGKLAFDGADQLTPKDFGLKPMERILEERLIQLHGHRTHSRKPVSDRKSTRLNSSHVAI